MKEEPDVVILMPPCGAWSATQNINDKEKCVGNTEESETVNEIHERCVRDTANEREDWKIQR